MFASLGLSVLDILYIESETDRKRRGNTDDALVLRKTFGSSHALRTVLSTRKRRARLTA